VVVDSTLTTTLSLPWPMGEKTLAPSDTPVSFAIHDVLEFEGGRITSKSNWIDGIAIVGQLAPA
jgi:predicted ester cyclase